MISIGDIVSTAVVVFYVMYVIVLFLPVRILWCRFVVSTQRISHSLGRVGLCCLVKGRRLAYLLYFGSLLRIGRCRCLFSVYVECILFCNGCLPTGTSKCVLVWARVHLPGFDSR